MQKKRYALVGAGSRASMFIDALATSYHDVAELVALCDQSQTMRAMDPSSSASRLTNLFAQTK